MAKLRRNAWDPMFNGWGSHTDMGTYVHKVSSFYGPMIQVNGGNPYQPHRDATSTKKNNKNSTSP